MMAGLMLVELCTAVFKANTSSGSFSFQVMCRSSKKEAIIVFTVRFARSMGLAWGYYGGVLVWCTPLLLRNSSVV